MCKVWWFAVKKSNFDLVNFLTFLKSLIFLLFSVKSIANCLESVAHQCAQRITGKEFKCQGLDFVANVSICFLKLGLEETFNFFFFLA